MGYPTKLLSDGERIVMETRPHWRALAMPLFVLLVTIAVTAFLSAKLANDGVSGTAQTVLYVAVVVVIIGWVIRPFLFWLTTQYVFTDRRIIVRSGLIARHGRDMPIARVNDVSFHKTIWERLLNCGTLVVESAGEQGQLVIAQVPDVEHIQRDIYRLHEADDERRRRGTGMTPPPEAGATGPPQENPTQEIRYQPDDDA